MISGWQIWSLKKCFQPLASEKNLEKTCGGAPRDRCNDPLDSCVVCWMCIVGVTTLGIFRNDPMGLPPVDSLDALSSAQDWPSFLIVSSYSLVKSPISMAPHFWWTWSNRNHHYFSVAKNPAFFRVKPAETLAVEVKLEDLAPQQLADFLSVELVAQEQSWGDLSEFDPPKNNWLVVTGTWMDYDFPLILFFLAVPTDFHS